MKGGMVAFPFWAEKELTEDYGFMYGNEYVPIHLHWVSLQNAKN